ncbi:MAG: hypothetical protein ABIF06_01220 [bacterium]
MLLEKFISLFHTELVTTIYQAALSSAPVWVPLLFVFGWFSFYINYKRRKWIGEQDSVLLEIKIPREIFRSPQAMEMFLSSLHNASAGNLLKVYGEGSLRPWFSLEIASLGGEVHFYVWMLSKFQSIVESQLYAQFSNVEVHEVKDYAIDIHHDPSIRTFGWFGQLKLTKEDSYPIKTYVDYGLHEDPKEEYKNDPLVALLEFMGSLKKGEQAWVQVLIQGHTKEGLKLGRLITKPDWKKGVEKEIEEIVKKSKTKIGDEEKPIPLSKGQQEIISAMERNMGRWPFDVMIRATYFANIDIFNPTNNGGLLGSFRQFSSQTLNGFKPGWDAEYTYPWQDFRGAKKMRNQRRLLEAYKRRSFFNPPFKNFHGQSFILTTEELATIFHFPSHEVASTPTLTRIPSKKAEAPSNLPI